MKRLPVVLSIAALVIAVMGVTSLGEAAKNALPFARNADRIDMLHASTRAKAGQLYPLGKNAKFPASVLSVTRGPRGYPGVEGPRGIQGEKGVQGAQGPAGVFSAKNVTQVDGPSTYMAPNTPSGDPVGESLATCPAGGLAIAGGWDGEDQLPPVDATVGYNKRYGWTSWGVIMTNNNELSAATYHAFVICAISGTATAQQSIAPSASVVNAVSQDAAALRAATAASR